MEKTIFLLIFGALLLVSCTRQESTQLEGAWETVYAKGVSGDSVIYEFPEEFTGSNIKMWTKNHFAFVGKFNWDSTEFNHYGGGTYKIEGNRYVESVTYHNDSKTRGKTLNMLVEIINDTLFQTFPVNDDGQIDSSNYYIDVFVRLD